MINTDISSEAGLPHRLSNGLTVVLFPAPHRHQVLLSLMVRTGSRHERAGENGLTHLVEHMLFRGNALCPDADALNQAFEEVGGMANGQTGVESTEFDLVSHPDKLPRALELMASLVHAPTFGDLEKERRILTDELAYDYNQRGALISPSGLMAQLLWPEHPLGRLVGGTPEGVAEFSLPQVEALFRRAFHPQNMILALAGKLEPAAALAAAEQAFAVLPSLSVLPSEDLDWAAPMPAPPPLGQGPRLQVVEDDDNQIHLQFSFPAPGYNEESELATQLLCRLLDDGPTSRLQRIIREDKALVYSIQAGYTAYGDSGQIDIVTSVQPPLLKSLLDELAEVLADFRKEGPTEAELQRAKMRHLFELDFEEDSLSAQVERHAWSLLYSQVRTIDQEREALKKIHREELWTMANTLLDPRYLHLVAVGPNAQAITQEITRCFGPITAL